MTGLSFDVSHLLAGALVLISFMLLYQTRLYALLNVYSAQAVVLSLSVAWQAFVQDATHLYVTAAVTLPSRRWRSRSRCIASSPGSASSATPRTSSASGQRCSPGWRWSGLSVVVMLRITGVDDVLAREDLAFALSVVLLGMLMMVVSAMR